MKNLFFLIICLISVNLSAQQDPMFTKYMFNSLAFDAGDHDGQLIPFLQTKMREVKATKVTKQNARKYGISIQLQLRKQRSRSLEKVRNQKGVITTAHGKLSISKSTTKREMNTFVALVNNSNQVISAAQVRAGSFDLEGLRLGTGDSGKVKAVVFQVPPDNVGGFVYVLLPYMTYDSLEPMENDDPGLMILP